ncbi:MAG: SMI1/KNR4 family protein [Labilithrix sp.]|nr:SMI1/KNR4 family protein [Labilithrix sp.]
MPPADESAADSLVPGVLTEIEAWLAEHAAAVSGRLPPGAPEASIKELEVATSVALPAGYRAFLLRHDGGMPWRSYDLLSVDEVLTAWKSMTAMQEQGTFKDAEVSTDDGRVAETWWSRGWIPIARDSGGNLVCIDMAPGPKGRAGQIIRWDTVDGPVPTEHASFDTWLQAFRDDLSARKYALTEDEILEFKES